MPWSVGVDLGQARDFTAIAIVEWVGAECRVRHVERLPLGTGYDAIVTRVWQLVGALPDCRLIVDAGGVGRAVVDQLRAAGLDPVPVTITVGKTARSHRAGGWTVPKKALIQGLIAALEGDRLKIAQGLPAGPALMKELAAFRRRIGRRGHVALEAAGSEHDDLVIALALSLWRPEASQ